MTATEFLAEFPATERNYHTGGNCEAWYLKFPNGFALLLTDLEGFAPSMDDAKVLVSVEDENGDNVDFEDEGGAVTWKLAAKMAQGARDGVWA